jgi:hypothetical protein
MINPFPKSPAVYATLHEMQVGTTIQRNKAIWDYYNECIKLFPERYYELKPDKLTGTFTIERKK